MFSERPTRTWVEDEIADAKAATDKEIADLYRRLAALERLLQGVLGITQEEMDRLLEKP